MLTLAFDIQPIKANTIFFDDFSSDSGVWEILGDANRDPVNQYLVLTENVNNQGGAAFFNNTFRTHFTANFSYKAGGGSGADGFVVFFYKQKYSSIGYGGGLGFAPVGEIVPGYGIEFDNWRNIAHIEPPEHGDPSANHIALIKDHVGNHLIYVNDSRTEDNNWHHVSVTVEESSVRVLVDQGLVFQWNGAINRTFNCFGFSAGTGSGTNWHLIDDFSIKIETPTIEGDVNHDGIVDIFDGVIMGVAFGSRPGDPNWNPIADIVPDNFIDIQDVALWAIHFGETW